MAYQKAVDAYRQYLKEDPKAADKAKVEKAIGVLEAEIKRLKDNPKVGPGSGSGASTRPRFWPGRSRADVLFQSCPLSAGFGRHVHKPA